MSNLLFPIVTSALGAAAETVTLAAQVLAVVLGLRAVTDALDILAKAIAALRWLAGLLQLVLMLVCSAIGDVLPLVGRHAGRAAGTAYRLGRQARALYDAHLAPAVTSIDQSARAFVISQLGTAYPALTAAIAPVAAPSSPSTAPEPAALTVPAPVSPATATAPLTRRQLLALAKAQGLPRYSRLTTAQLREAIAA